MTDLDYKKAQRELNPSEECDSVTEMIPANVPIAGKRLRAAIPNRFVIKSGAFPT